MNNSHFSADYAANHSDALLMKPAPTLVLGTAILAVGIGVGWLLSDQWQIPRGNKMIALPSAESTKNADASNAPSSGKTGQNHEPENTNSSVSKSSERPRDTAMPLLREMITEGDFDPKKFEEYKAGTTQGDTYAQFMRGFYYDEVLGDQKKKAAMVKWDRKAADQDFAEAQSDPETAYNEGAGVENYIGELNDRNPFKAALEAAPRESMHPQS